MKKKIRSYWFKFLNLIDPAPVKSKNESRQEWLARVPLKYAVRYVNQHYYGKLMIDEEDIRETVAKFEVAKERELMKRVLTTYIKYNKKVIENYKLVMARKSLEG